MSVTYIIGSLNQKLPIEVDLFSEQLKKRWHNVKIHQLGAEAHSSLQWEFDDDSGENISGDLYHNGITFRVFEDKSIGVFARWTRSIFPLEYDLVLYMNDLSHHPITLHEGITDEEIQNGFSVPLDIDKYKSMMS